MDRGFVGTAHDARRGSEFHEDLPALAVRAVALASRLCDDCIHYHGSWPALRLVEHGGLDFDRPHLLPLFRELAGNPSRRHWLIAGMADTGLVATVGAAIWPISQDARITLVDRCETPLRLCWEYGERLGRRLDTVRADLNQFSPPELQDVVFAHSVLAHVPGTERVAMAARFRQWLTQDGCLILSARLDDVLDQEDIDRQTDPAHIRKMIAVLKKEGVDDEATLRQLSVWLPRSFADRSRRRGAHPTIPDLTALLDEAGFANVRIVAEFAPPPRQLRPSGKNQRRAIIAAYAA